MWRAENSGAVCEGICHVYIVINLRVVLYVIDQSTLVLARVHIIHTSIRSYTTTIYKRCQQTGQQLIIGEKFSNMF
jgi:hypothetical protein